ncbi:MAG: FAD-dependent oxidoreductase [Candidatus Latescibacterota bacterium]
MEEHADVLVIGAGVVGVSAAWFLQQEGASVTLVDQGPVGAGSSYGNAGLVVPSHSVPLAHPGAVSLGLRWLLDADSPFYVRPRLSRDLIHWLWRFRRAATAEHVRRATPLLCELHLASRRLFAALAQGGLNFGFAQRGGMLLYRGEAGRQAVCHEAETMAAHGVCMEHLSADQARQRHPGVELDVAGALYCAEDAHLDPARFVQTLAHRAAEGGARIRTGTEVLGFDTAGDTITTVHTTRGRLCPREVVLAAGSWSQGLARRLGLELPIQPAKGYSVTVRAPEHPPAFPVILTEARVAVTPLGEALRFAGTLELAGMDMTVNQRRVAAILRAVPEYLPSIRPHECELVEIWRGLRPCTPDGLPYLGRTGRWRNLTVAAGHAMIGVSLGPITGLLTSQICAGRTPQIDVAALDPERYHRRG